jgi:hypothetical protein
MPSPKPFKDHPSIIYAEATLGVTTDPVSLPDTQSLQLIPVSQYAQEPQA